MRIRILLVVAALAALFTSPALAIVDGTDPRVDRSGYVSGYRVATAAQVVGDSAYVTGQPAGYGGVLIDASAKYLYITQIGHQCSQATITSGNQDLEIKQGVSRFGSVAVPSTASNIITFDPPLRFTLASGGVSMVWTSNWSAGTHRIWWQGYTTRR